MGTLLKYIHLAKNQLFDGSRVALLTPLKETRYLLVIINQIVIAKIMTMLTSKKMMLRR